MVERNEAIDPVLKAGIAHLWFVTIHPFDDGNGRIARAITDSGLGAIGEQRSAVLQHVLRNPPRAGNYYRMLETTQKGGLDITLWLDWFLQCLDRAVAGAEGILGVRIRAGALLGKAQARDL